MKKMDGFYKGINLGGWISQCSEYTEEHYNTFIVEKDIETIKSWGLDHVRLPVDYNVVQNEDGSFIESGFKHIDDCIAWCKKYGLKIVLDLHKTCGYVFDDAKYCGFFFDEKLQEMFFDLWMEFTRRYGKEEIVVFELLNEVTEERFSDTWNELSAKAVKMIHRVVPEKTIVVGGIYNNSIYGLAKLDKPADDNVVYTFHCYDPMVFTHQKAYWVPKLPSDLGFKYRQKVSDVRKASFKYFQNQFEEQFEDLDQEAVISSDYFENLLKTAFEVAKKYNVELYCGEYGVIDKAQREDAVEWFKDIHEVLEKYHITRSAWSYKLMDFDLRSDENIEVRKYL